MWFFHIKILKFQISVFSDLLRDDPCDSRRSDFFFFFWEGGWLVGYCMMIKITQMALSYYLNKLRKDCFLKQNGLNDPESAARARGAICRTFKSIQMIQSARISAERCYSTRWFFYEWRWEFEIASAVIKLPTLHVCSYSTVFSFDSLLVLAALRLVWDTFICI